MHGDNASHSVKDLPPSLRQAAEALLGRSLREDEMVGVFAFPASRQAERTDLQRWEQDMNELIDSFPQDPVLSDEAISRESIYTREDDLA